MADGAWMLVLVAVGGSLIAACVGGGAALRRLARRNRDNAERIDELSRRLQLVEARLTAGASTIVHGPGSRRAMPGSAPTLIEIPDLAASPVAPDTEPEVESSTESLGRHDDVRALARAGVSPDLIARRTNRPVGQVELILALQKRSKEPRRTGPHARPE